MKRIVFLLLALTTFKLFSGIGEYHIKIGDIEVVSNSSVSHDCLDPIVGTDETNPLKLCHSSRNPNESANSWAREAQGMVYYTSTSYFYAHATDLRFIINNDRIGGIGLFNTDDFGHPVASIDLEFIVETMQESNCFELRHHINPTHGLYDAHIGEITYNHAENLLYVVVSPTRGTGDDVLATFNYIENDGFIFRSCMNNFADEPLFFNKMDNLLYLSSNNRRIKGFKKDFEKNSVFSNDLIVRVINLKGAPSIVGSFSGGSFSPNGRFFVRVAEKQDSDYAGLYIYEIDKKHLTQNELNDKFWLNKNMHLLDYNFTQFINFKFQGGTYCGEMEGMDIYPAKNGDIHVVFLQNEAVDDVFIFHFKALKDSDEDGIKDLYDNCPYDYNPEQEDYNNNGMGYICEDIDKDGIKNSEDECPLVHQIFGDVNFCLDNDTIDEYGHHVGDYVCNNPSNERKSCLYFYNQLTYKQRLEAVDKFKKERLEYLRENRWEPSFYLNGDNYLAIVENSPNRHLIDSCPNHINPLVKPFRSDSELIVGMCLNGKDTNGYCFPEDIITNTNQNDVVVWGGGAQLNPNTYLHGTVINGAYYWQPDHNLDGKGDACDTTDFGFVRVWGESYDKWLSSNDTATYTDVSLLHNHSITLENIELSESDVPFGANIDNRYCWMSSTEYAGDKWGDLGYCTLSKKYAEEQGENSNGVISYGFSHGSDPKPVDEDGKDSWKQPTMIRVSNKSEFYTIPVVSKGFVPGKETNRWKWQKDLENQSTYYDIWESKVEAVDNYDIEGNGASFMQYTLSTGYAKKSADEYLKGEGVDKEVNPDYFLNTNTAARAYRPYASPNGINYYRYTYRAYKSPLESLEDPRITSLLESGSNRLADTYLDPVINIWEMGDGFVEVIKRRKLDAGVATLFVTENNEELLSGVMNGNQSEMVVSRSPYGSQDWHQVATISFGSVQQQEVRSVAREGFDLYFVIGETVYKTVAISDDANGATHELRQVAPLPSGLTLPHIIAKNGKVVLLANAENSNQGELSAFKLNDNAFEEIQSAVRPPALLYRNIAAFSSKIIIAGGGVQGANGIETVGAVWRLTASGFEQIAEINDSGIALLDLLISEDEHTLHLVSQRAVKDGETTLYTINETGEVSTEKLPVVGYTDTRFLPTGYCIVDEGDEANPGMYNNGSCEAVENYNSRTVNYFDYKLTLAGQGNRLFVGGLTGIRMARINESGTLENSFFKWIGRSVNNIQIAGDKLYAASSDKIRIYTIGENGLTRSGSISADNPRNIRVYEGKLFVADGRRVSVWDISGETPVFEREIATNYKVKELEIANGKLYTYQEESYWYWFWLRKHTKFAVFEIGKEQGDEERVYEVDVNCKDSEMMQDSNYIYLGCKNGAYRMSRQGTLVGEPIDGEKRYFRDSYYYRGKVYQTFSGAVHISE